MKMLTDYKTAVSWCNNALILLNNITDIDPDFIDYNIDLFTEDEEGNFREFYQFFLTDMTQFDAEWLQKTFDLTIGYSPKLEKYVLCVDHYGTAWNGVPCEVYSKEWWDINGAKYAYKD